MTFEKGAVGGIVDRPRLEVVGGRGHGRRLSPMDRARIEAGLEVGMSQAAIARQLGVAPSTISRELSRRPQVASRRWRRSEYDAEVADHDARRLRARPKRRKLDGNEELRGVVVLGLNHRWSPEEIAGRLPRLYPDREDMRVSHETIYQSLYVQGAGALRQELKVTKALRTGRTGRVPRSKLPPRNNRTWIEGHRITDRPAEAADRAVPGHWEGDLVVGPENSAIITLVERCSRFTLLGRLPGARDSPTVTDLLAAMIKTLPGAITTITWDQGSEMAERATFTLATNIEVYFADPHSPWQRPTNENTNGLIRDFYPKGTNFNDITDRELATTQDLLNTRPRKVLHYATPSETLNTNIQRAIALTA